MLAFLLASAACWSLALTMVSMHWWHFFSSSCRAEQQHQGQRSAYSFITYVQKQKPLPTLSAMVAMYLMHSMSDGNWLTSLTRYCTTFT